MVSSDIANHRFVNQQIASPLHKRPCDVVASLLAMQAQDYLGALWAIGLRLPGATEADIKQAIADRTIIRTWPMRGTLHFVAAADVHWMLELLTPRIIAANANRLQRLELNTAVFARSKRLFIEALQGGSQLTRGEMYQLLERARISTAGQRGLHILWRLAQEGIICFAAHAGKQPTFALLDEWVPQARHLKRDEALAELARRYFTNHGPATLQDLVWWSGLKVTDARAALEMVSSELTSETMDGSVYWMHQEKLARCDIRAAKVNFLPCFDEYLLGYKDRSACLDSQHKQKATPDKPTVMRSGRVIGTWKRTFMKNTAVITTSLFSSLKKSERRNFLDAAGHYSHFLGMPVEFTA